jgi:peptidoglycan/LPS O-acetylase OafA/YrhL
MSVEVENPTRPMHRPVAEEAKISPTTAAPRLRLTYVDGVRALAAVFVVVHHMWLKTYPEYPRNGGPAAGALFLYGHVAVAVFIVVSGFSLSIAPARHDWQMSGGFTTFLRRRAWRILPTYWAALALSCFIFAVITPNLTGDGISAKSVGVHAVLLQDVIDSPKPNGAFWSIAIEWQIYFLFPLFLLFRRRLGSALLFLGAGAAAVGVYELATRTLTFHRLIGLTPQFAVLFVLGMGAASMISGGGVLARRAHVMPWFASGLAATFVAVCLVKGPVWVSTRYFWLDLIVGTAVALLLASLAADRPGWLHRLLSSRPLRSTGLYSYSIYCVHLPMLWLVWHFGIARIDVGRAGQFVLLLVLGLPVVLFGCYVFSLVFEKPFLTYRSFHELGEWLSSLTGKQVSSRDDEPESHEVSPAHSERVGASV